MANEKPDSENVTLHWSHFSTWHNEIEAARDALVSIDCKTETAKTVREAIIESLEKIAATIFEKARSPEGMIAVTKKRKRGRPAGSKTRQATPPPNNEPPSTGPSLEQARAAANSGRNEDGDRT